MLDSNPVLRKYVAWFLYFSKIILLFFGFYLGEVWAKNLIMFFIWLNFVLYILLIFSIDYDLIKLIRERKDIPIALETSLDLCMLVIIASNGWFITGLALGFIMLFEQYVYSVPLQEIRKHLK